MYREIVDICIYLMNDLFKAEFCHISLSLARIVLKIVLLKFSFRLMLTTFDDYKYYFRVSLTELKKGVFKHQYKTAKLFYDEKFYRESLTPILWIDEKGDVRWNQAAEQGMINYLSDKQFPNLDRVGTTSFDKQELMKTCAPQSLFVLHQHWSGFFSRVLCFIAQFGQTLYSPRIAVLRGTKFAGDRGHVDDFLQQGITRYFLPISICSAYEHNPGMNDLKELIESSPNALQLSRSHVLHEHGKYKEARVLLSTEFWKLDYHHVPIRKWLFDRRESKVSYNSSIEELSDHSDEHIYAPKNENNYPIGDWINTNKPDAFSSDLLPNKGNYTLTWQDYVFGSFLRYMFVLFFGSRNSPRLEVGVRLLAKHWSEYLIDKYSLPHNATVFDHLAGFYIRRGDKSSEDTFWHKHHHWRNISLYVKGVVDEEERQQKRFKYLFVMTDDSSVMSSIQDFANPKSKGTDEPYARTHLRGRDILYNVFAPQPCFDPFLRIGFEQFLVSMRFLIEHSALTIGHTDSNVFRFFREVVYAQRQHWPGVQTYTYVQNAPNSLENQTMS